MMTTTMMKATLRFLSQKGCGKQCNTRRIAAVMHSITWFFDHFRWNALCLNYFYRL